MRIGIYPFKTASHLGRFISDTLHSKKGYALLDKYGLEFWDAGACHVLVKALQQWLETGEIKAVTFPDLPPPADRYAQHFILKIRDSYFDGFSGNAVSTIEQLRRRWGRRIKILSPDQVAIHKDTLCPVKMVRETVTLLDRAEDKL